MSQPAPQPAWKEEVNRRLAAHKNRKGMSVVEQDASAQTRSAAGSRAALAAARVAARYANAPSFSEMQAAEAHAALRAAEAATRAALKAQVAAQAALFHLETAEQEQFSREEDSAMDIAAEEPVELAVRQPWEPEADSVAATSRRLEIRWEPDLPARPAGPPAAPARHESEEFETAEEVWPTATGRSADWAANQPIEPVEPAQPIHANLIEFPRELVATRRMRPRLTRAEHDGTGDLFGQLSIFEVDPSAISIEPEAPTAEAEVPAPAWNGAEWSGIELDEQPDEDTERQGELAPALHLAPFGLRLMAIAVDAALIAGAACAVVAEAARHMQHPPAMKAAELGAMAALLVAGVAYYALFFALAKSTPGMKYARISLCTFDDEIPTPAQLRGRLGALLLSLLPVGLGVAWAIFDDDHLAWHDRLSRTYPRKD